MGTRTPDSGSVAPALLGKTYTSFATAIDLLADCATLTGGASKEACRRIRVGSGAGVVACYFKGAPETKVLVDYAAREVDDVQLVKIGDATDGTTVTRLTVYW